MAHLHRAAGPGRLLLPITLLLCLGLAWLTWSGGDQLSRAMQDNLLRLRLERVLHIAPPPADTDLLTRLRTPGFATENPRVAWLGGYYVFSQTFSTATAQALWAMAPEYAAKQLLWQARTAPDRQERLRAATAAATLAPASLPAQLARVEALIANDRWSEAGAALEQLLAAWPNDADVNALAGRVAWRNGGTPEQARALLERAMTLEPTNTRAPGYMIDFLKNNGTSSELEAFLKQVLTANMTPALNAGFYANLAEIYLRQGNLAEAAAPLNTALDLDPGNPWINGMAGEYYLRTGQFAQAILHFSDALLGQKNADYLVGMGDAYWAQGDQAQAKSAYCDAYAVDNQHIAVLKRLPERKISCP